MEKMSGESLNIVANNIEKLKSIFPEVFNEDKVDFEKLEAVLGEYKDKGAERYNFSWPGKSKAIRIAQTPSTGTLRPCKDESKNWDETQNLYIEGDNLEVLKLLQKSYYGKVKMIYIDPPYNTGNDFVYKDDFKDNVENYLAITGQKNEAGNKTTTNTESNGRYHSNWLNMMYPRLKLARNLLNDEGLIFISIDDNEVDNLRKICNEIFGENNFRGQITRATGTPTGQGTDRLVNELDYILVYSKTFLAKFRGLPFSSEDEKIYNQQDERGKYLIRPLRKTGGEDRMEDRPSMYYSIKNPDGEKLYPIAPSGYKSRWRCGENRYNELIKEGLIEWKKLNENGENSWRVYQKFYLEGRTKQPSNLWTKIEGNKKATLQVKSIFGNTIFDFPKPIELIKQSVKIATEADDIILDFFSGSATTGEAVINLNVEDNTKRKFILVQIQEKLSEKSQARKMGYNTICEIGKERIRRSGDIIREENKLKEGIENLDIGFKVFRLDSSNINKWDVKNENELESTLLSNIENIKSDRTEEDILYEILLKYGIDLNMPIEEHEINGKKVFDVGFGAIIACLDKEITLDVIEEIGRLKEKLNPDTCRCVFVDNGFSTDSVKTNVVQILKKYKINDVKSI